LEKVDVISKRERHTSRERHTGIDHSSSLDTKALPVRFVEVEGGFVAGRGGFSIFTKICAEGAGGVRVIQRP
jgi:hypothetical protein